VLPVMIATFNDCASLLPGRVDDSDDADDGFEPC
jgi:hypothetical protein